MKNLSIFPAFFISFALAAQEPISIQNGCNFMGEETDKEYYTFSPSGEASKIVKQILDGAGSLSYNSFILKESNVQNALATTEGKSRYVLYSTAFLEKFKGDAKTKWAAYIVLAHEIGHHLNGHDFTEKDPKKRRSMELEADIFAGAACRTLGATLDEALAGIEIIKQEGETVTHPSGTARKAAVINGWKKQDELLKKRPDKNDEDMEIAEETLVGKIYQKFQGVEAILISAKMDKTLKSADTIYTATFHFLIRNTTDSIVAFLLFPDRGEVSRTSIVDLGTYDVVEEIEVEGQKTLNNYALSVKIAEDASSNFKVIFKDMKQRMEVVPELRVTIRLDGEKMIGKKKTLVFRNIPMPYQWKK